MHTTCMLRLSVPCSSQVYKARWQGTLVAVKILHADESKESSQQDDFKKEVAMLEGLRHTHIVNYLGHLFEESGEVRASVVLGIVWQTHECDMCTPSCSPGTCLRIERSESFSRSG